MKERRNCRSNEKDSLASPRLLRDDGPLHRLRFSRHRDYAAVRDPRFPNFEVDYSLSEGIETYSRRVDAYTIHLMSKMRPLDLKDWVAQCMYVLRNKPLPEEILDVKVSPDCTITVQIQRGQYAIASFVTEHWLHAWQIGQDGETMIFRCNKCETETRINARAIPRPPKIEFTR
jgi:hypothetical protein